ncbi:hypothetical protein [Fictibacillus enclensis]|uniref:hypothetical protein n=1 Tax=Fictibacillus enclensis TaxID=1017270 RepID=UPI0024C08C6D|nr:hypothetical protein [Fictibacillus enclensis]WHY71265.1 hypothetical protein QNH15_19965 [Fictibacillus enclensis]
MNSIKVLKSLAFYFLIILLAINIFLFTQQKKKEKSTKEVVSQNIELKNENENMKNKVKLFSPSGREQHYNTMIKDTKEFMDLAYIQKKEGYEERREKAKGLMSKELLDRFFPADTTYQDQVATTIYNDEYYVKKLEPDQKRIDVIVKFNHDLKYLATGNVDKSQLFALVTFKLEGNKWIAEKVEDVEADSTSMVQNKSKK